MSRKYFVVTGILVVILVLGVFSYFVPVKFGEGSLLNLPGSGFVMKKMDFNQKLTSKKVSKDTGVAVPVFKIKTSPANDGRSFREEFLPVRDGISEVKYYAKKGQYFEFSAYWGVRNAAGQYIKVNMPQDSVNFTYDYLFEMGDEVSIDNFRCAYVGSIGRTDAEDLAGDPIYDERVFSCYALTDVSVNAIMDMDFVFDLNAFSATDVIRNVKLYLGAQKMGESTNELQFDWIGYSGDSTHVRILSPYPKYASGYVWAKCVSPSTGATANMFEQIRPVDAFTDTTYSILNLDFGGTFIESALPYNCEAYVSDATGVPRTMVTDFVMRD